MSATVFRHSRLTEMNEQALWLPRLFSPYLQEPLQQRPAGSSGKNGACDLSFAVARGKTRLAHAFVTHPFHFTTPWYLDSAVPGMAVAYLQTPAGGLIQGDRAQMRFTFGPRSHVHLTTQAAEKIHSMTANCAVQHLVFTLDSGAYVEYCPEPVILFPGARFAQSVTVSLAPEASFFFSEIFLSRSAADGTPFEALATTLRVQETNANLLMHDRSFADTRIHDLTGPGRLGKCHVWGQALLVGPVVPATWSQEIHELLSTESDLCCGTTLLPRSRGVFVKVVGTNAPTVRRTLHRVWNYVREHFLGVPAPSFPK